MPRHYSLVKIPEPEILITVPEAPVPTNVNAYGKVTAGENVAGLVVALNPNQRAHLEVWMKYGGACAIALEGSRNNIDWREVDSWAPGAAGEDHSGYLNGYAYVRLRSATTGIDLEFELSANP